MSDVAVAEHALLSDCGAAALVTSRGSVDWLCLPRFDSPPVFGRLLDHEAGHFSITPTNPGDDPTWSYRPASLVLDTTWHGATGTLVVSDAMAMSHHARGHDLGRTSPGLLLRQVRCTQGTMSVRVEYAPRPEFGLIRPRLTRVPHGVVAVGGATVLTLNTDAELDIDGAVAASTLLLRAGEEVVFALRQTDAWGPTGEAYTPRSVRRRLADTASAWRSWSRLHQKYDGPFRELVLHSGVVLQGLTYARSGSMVAAATTSLPEGVSSGRTWDYRFTWVRDASMTMQGLYTAACPDEAVRFFSFLARAAATQLDRGLDLQIMFGIGGERDLSERELPHLSGWRDSGPVRVGNGAWDQHQLDVYGALLDAAHTFRDQLGALDADTRAFLVAAVDRAAARWQEDDQGIWEFRGPARPFLYSKLMCWVALDRGIRLAGQLNVGQARLTAWNATRADIRDAIETRGWSDHVGAYTQFFGSDTLDASALMTAIVGFHPRSDPRLLSTIDAVADGLADSTGLLFRYRGDDGLCSPEGTFVLCTFWLAHALALTGQTQRSREAFMNAASHASSLGLLAEQVDPATGELLGNYPQAFSHLGLINAAQALADVEDQ